MAEDPKAEAPKVVREVALSVTALELQAIAISISNAGWKPQDFRVIEGLSKKIKIAGDTLSEAKG